MVYLISLSPGLSKKTYLLKASNSKFPIQMTPIDVLKRFKLGMDLRCFSGRIPDNMGQRDIQPALKKKCKKYTLTFDVLSMSKDELSNTI